MLMMEELMAMRKRLEIAFPNAAGIDVGASSHFVAVPPDRAEEAVREFGVYTSDLQALADWLHECEVDTVAMESTGVYWIALYELLERRGFKVHLVNTRHVKNVPGRKSDVVDCQWLQQLMGFGVLSGAYRPVDEVCVLRAVMRHRDGLLRAQARQIQRVQKALVQMNVQLTEVLSDVMGATGQAIIRAIVAGERDPVHLAKLRDHRVRANEAQIAKALHGNWREEHLFALEQSLALFDAYQTQLSGCDAKLQSLLGRMSRHSGTPSGKPRAHSSAKNAPKFDLRSALYSWCGVDLTRIDGLDVTTVLKVLAEIGTDLSRFASIKHFCSWMTLCPGTKISGGKRLSGRTTPSINRAKLALKMAASNLIRSQSAMGAYYRRLCARMDKPRAITATAHKLARLIYLMLTRGQDYVDRGEAYYEERHKQRVIASLRRKAASLGMQLNPAPTQL
jgi:transposase